MTGGSRLEWAIEFTFVRSADLILHSRLSFNYNSMYRYAANLAIEKYLF
ncbi:MULTISPECIES: hypothetical protein [unclassified Microcoleus]|nr:MULTISPECIES: hypothetical protein [unclassified Microcoleus]MCC3441228.1 hypothetical protein [Microcoleus sp. PH2017_03_ELD_O_A]MCC3505029.1 hypothetical protein [Microcoleus sp. PH2017_19_SFW_U_A]MCC3524776.1 hypothetical protein [Microcoleus sp. PH2017_20_SFW_D_A]MCC3555675.1 hypothetical protein [Microcoleus sp. PH2017_35_SFW_U_B]